MTHGTKPVLKEQGQRKQSGQRKEERKQRRMNDGNNDEFSAAKETRRGRRGRSTKRKCVYSLNIRVYLCVSVSEVDGEIQGKGENKKKEKMRGHGAKTGSQPNQFGLAESGCTISHQSTFSTLSDLPSIHRGHPLCTLPRNKTWRRKRDRGREKKHIRTCRHTHGSTNLILYSLWEGGTVKTHSHQKMTK